MLLVVHEPSAETYQRLSLDKFACQIASDLTEDSLRTTIRSARRGIFGMASAGLVVVASGSGLAEEAAYCLTCTGPDQMYLCRVRGPGVNQNDIFKLYCIARTARKGSHDSCAVTGTSDNCPGVLRAFKYNGPSLPAALADNPKMKRFISKAEADYRSTPQVSAARPRAPAPTLNPPRRSLLLRMGHTAQSAGAAMGGFAQRSYKCMRSLFRQCGREAQE